MGLPVSDWESTTVWSCPKLTELLVPPHGSIVGAALVFDSEVMVVQRQGAAFFLADCDVATSLLLMVDYHSALRPTPGGSLAAFTTSVRCQHFKFAVSGCESFVLSKGYPYPPTADGRIFRSKHLAAISATTSSSAYYMYGRPSEA